MKLTPWIFFVLIFSLACSSRAPIHPSTTAQDAPVLVTATQTSSPLDVSTAAPAVSNTSLYISATMHIESKFDSWPQDTETFLVYLQQTTDAGIHWSIGGDIGWLENAQNAQEIVQRSAAMGVQWDVHAHKIEDLAKTASILSAWGVTPTGVGSGFLISDLDALRQPLTYQSYTWVPQILWGGVKCAGHKEGCDDHSAGLYRPASTTQFSTHDPNGNLIYLGGGDHTLQGAEVLAAAIASGEYSAPVISFTLMMEPETLRIARSATDDVSAILAFAERINQYSFVHWATIEETAQAWVTAGGVPIQIQTTK